MDISLKNCKIVIFFGGPSNERNISLDSARTFYDSIRHHLSPENIVLVFVSIKKKFYYLHPNWIYSNTIEDFEDLLEKEKQPTKQAVSRISKNSFFSKKISSDKNHILIGKELLTDELHELIDSSNAFFPMIHGEFGEDGVLTMLLEKRGRKSIIGSDSSVLYTSFKKSLAYEELRKLGFTGYPYFLINTKEWQRDKEKTLKQIFNIFSYQRIKKVVVKPNNCGSSDGVSVVQDMNNSFNLDDAIQYAFSFSKEVLVEKYIQGKEFSLIVFEEFDHTPIALFPTEIVLTKNQSKNAFYSRQKKYMPGSGANHITPAHFKPKEIRRIREEGEHIFEKFGFKDWARFDGFLLLNGEIIWSDLNSLPGIGQDSLLFQQSIYLGIDTYNLSMYLLRKALEKEKQKLNRVIEEGVKQKIIGVLGGGNSSERQVSRMSWCNVIEKLDRLKTYELKYFFLDKKNHLWEVPRSYTLKHTTEEIEQLIKNNLSSKTFPRYHKVHERVKNTFPETTKQNFKVTRLSWSVLAEMIDYLFICLHGGIGENGTVQRRLASHGIKFNGSDEVVSKLCFDKSKNHTLIEMVKQVNVLKRDYGSSKIVLPRQTSISLKKIKIVLHKNHFNYSLINQLSKSILDNYSTDHYLQLKNKYIDFYKKFKLILLAEITRQISEDGVFNLKLKEIKQEKFVVKPSADGCSTGVVICDDFYEKLPLYFLFLLSNYRSVPVSLFTQKLQNSSAKQKLVNVSKTVNDKYMKLPSSRQDKILFEEFLDVTKGFVELTVGVVGEKGKMMALLPSETVAETQVLSLDEKFNKGVGPNLTPPRKLNIEQIAAIRAEVADFANKIGLKDYARIDLFYHSKKNRLYLIEVNTLPGLTAATILFTQALITPQYQYPPSEFLDKIISFT